MSTENKQDAVARGVDESFARWATAHPDAIPDGIEEGVREAYMYWLMRVRDVTAVGCLQDGVEAATTKWLDAHKSEIIEAIAAAVTR